LPINKFLVNENVVMESLEIGLNTAEPKNVSPSNLPNLPDK